jgi:hypothetical protein
VTALTSKNRFVLGVELTQIAIDAAIIRIDEIKSNYNEYNCNGNDISSEKSDNNNNNNDNENSNNNNDNNNNDKNNDNDNSNNNTVVSEINAKKRKFNENKKSGSGDNNINNHNNDNNTDCNDDNNNDNHNDDNNDVNLNQMKIIKNTEIDNILLNNYEFQKISFFDINTDRDEDLFDFIYDYTFLCSFDPTVRTLWAEKMNSLLKIGICICITINMCMYACM